MQVIPIRTVTNNGTVLVPCSQWLQGKETNAGPTWQSLRFIFEGKMSRSLTPKHRPFFLTISHTDSGSHALAFRNGVHEEALANRFQLICHDLIQKWHPGIHET